MERFDNSIGNFLMLPFLSPTLLQGQTAWFLGTFNPVHQGHMAVAKAAIGQFGLQSVVFVPAGNSPWKHQDVAMTSCDQRIAALQSLISSDIELKECAVVSDVEARLADLKSQEILPENKVTYTWETVATLQHQRKQAGESPARLPLLIGSDALAGVSMWAKARWLVDNVCWLQAPRAGTPWLDSLDIDGETVFLNTLRISMPVVDVSSTQLRQQAALV
ncbi:MAG: nicotinate-nicotinamide nucleotide adenylyltransferase [Vampirovibrionales bacterium]|nr:nicotinate-nicotinamide nucleotide adenylyltransferase [Vampirovibrionales bacterium]